MTTQPSQAVCPANQHGATHHLIPRRSGPASELVCIFCRLSEATLRGQLADDKPAPHGHVQTLTTSPELEVVSACNECDWHTVGEGLADYEEIRSWAREHAAESGHGVLVTKTAQTTTTYRVLTGDEP